MSWSLPVFPSFSALSSFSRRVVPTSGHPGGLLTGSPFDLAVVPVACIGIWPRNLCPQMRSCQLMRCRFVSRWEGGLNDDLESLILASPLIVVARSMLDWDLGVTVRLQMGLWMKDRPWKDMICHFYLGAAEVMSCW